MIKLSSGLIVLLSLFGDDSTEVALRLACVVKLVVDDFILSNVEVTWKGGFEVAIVFFSDVELTAIVLFSDVKLTVIICFWSEVAKTKRATNMIAPIIMKATKNINKPIKTHFWVAMLLNECPLVRPHNFLALTNSKSILMSIDFEFIRARKSNSLSNL